MRTSRKAIRRERQKKAKPATLNLVSLMDIFTILVFFLMVNSSDVEVLEASSNIKLPDSVAEQRPEDRLLISIENDDLIVQGSKVASISELMVSKEPMILELKAALEREYEINAQGLAEQALLEEAVTIMGDRKLPYELLKRIMLTCQAANYTKIALAVNQVGLKSAELSPDTGASS